MEALPNIMELQSYSYERLNASIEQHETNIRTYENVIQKEQKRIEWLRAVIRAKQELEDGRVPINAD